MVRDIFLLVLSISQLKQIVPDNIPSCLKHPQKKLSCAFFLVYNQSAETNIQ